MKKISKQQIIKDPEMIPESPGIFRLEADKQILFLTKTSNLRRSLKKYLISKPENEQILKLISLCREISWQEEDSLLASLITEKIELSQVEPQFNPVLKKLNNPVYLRVSFNQVPYFGISEDTLKDDYYIGPFFNRFFPLDVIDLLHKLKQYPACEGSEFPCYKYKAGSCSGWCIKDASQLAQIIFNYYLSVNEDLLNELREKQKQLFEELEFLQEDKIKKQSRLLEKYYDMLRFFHINKAFGLEFTFRDYQVKIENGQIRSLQKEREKYEFPVTKGDFRQNEKLALEKDQLAESWIIYNYLKKKYSQKIKTLYLHSVQNLKKELGIQSGGKET